MNCCDYECNQGRDCPVRQSNVARVGRRTQAHPPLPPSPVRDRVKHLAKWMLAVIALLLYAALLAVVLL